jgi:hypothetical protein
MGKKKEFTVSRYCKWIYQFADRYIHAIKNNDKFYQLNTTESLNNAHDNKFLFRKIKKLTRKYIVNHLSKETTHYYTCNRKSGVILLGLDIDAHEGQLDAAQAAGWLQEVLSLSCYIESSTNGLGIHLYFLLEVERYQKSEAINSSIKVIADSIRELVSSEGFESNVDGIKGTLNIRDKAGLIQKHGQLIKLPRPLTQQQYDSLISIQPYTLAEITSKINQAKEEQGLLSKTETAPNQKAEKNTLSKTVIHGFTNVFRAPEGVTATDTDANKRKIYAISQFHLNAKRHPTIEEALDYYEAHCLTTGPRDAKRISNMSDALNYYAKNNNPNVKPNNELLDISPNVELVSSIGIPAEDMKYNITKTKQLNISVQDVAAFVTICNFITLEGTTTDSICPSRDRIVAMWDKLKSDGTLNNGCNNAKYKKLRELCVKYELLEIVEDYIRPIKYGDVKVQSGKGYTIAPGRLHHLHLKGKSHIADVQARANRDQPKLKLA